MMREDSNTSARATRNGVNSSQEITKAREKAPAKPKGDTIRAGNDSPTRSTKRRITKPNRPGFGETKEGRGSDYARIFIRQTLLETLRKVGTAVDPYGFFSSPVDPVADDCPDYYDVVDRETEAMDLGSIESMIKDGTISTVDEMDRLEHMKDRAMQDIVSDFIRQAPLPGARPVNHFRFLTARPSPPVTAC